MRWFRNIVAALAVLPPLAASAGEKGVRLDPASSVFADSGDGITIDMGLSRAVPYRLFLLDAPPRLVIDLDGVDLAGQRPETLDRSDRVVTLSLGAFHDGWSRLVAELDGAYELTSAEERQRGDAAEIRLRLSAATAEVFAAAVASGRESARAAAFLVPVDPAEPKRRQTGDAPLVVMLDPGHGGIDPGAEAGGVTEATLMLDFARELAALLRSAGMAVVMTRDSDTFVPLETRVSRARAAAADVFLSLHADTLSEGTANGATIYTLSAEASDTASARLAERHDRGDLLAGVDFLGQDDVLAAVLMDMSRRETQPRSDRLARLMAAAIRSAGAKLHRHPVQAAGFSVLKAPDIPSVLLEVGFLSSKADRARIDDPLWRATMLGAIRDALRDWATEDAAEARLLRR